MKRTFQLVALAVILISLASCDEKKIVTITDLPQSAQTYIQENVPDAKGDVHQNGKGFLPYKV